MKHDGKNINRPDFNAPPKDGKDHPVYELGQRERPAERAERPQPRIQPYTSRDKQLKYMLALRAQHRAAGTWNAEWDEAWGIKGLE